jgi:hypothetical protein
MNTPLGIQSLVVDAVFHIPHLFIPYLYVSLAAAPKVLQCYDHENKWQDPFIW